MENLQFGGCPEVLRVGDEQIRNLRSRVEGVERSKMDGEEILRGYKICPTRHGCSGATSCDYEYSGPVGR